jgi:hypothetical protein
MDGTIKQEVKTMVFNPIPEFFGNSLTQLNQKTTNIYDQETVTRMVAEAVKAEREACLAIAEKQRYSMNISLTSLPAQNGTAVDIANAIRARGEAV